MALLLCVASPEFRATRDGPHDVNVTAGHSVAIHCRTHAEPRARVAWYQNGTPLDRTYLRNLRTLTHSRSGTWLPPVNVSGKKIPAEYRLSIDAIPDNFDIT